MRFLTFSFMLLFVCLSAQAEEVSDEQNAVLQAMISLEIAHGYERHCVERSEGETNMILLGNTQHLAGYFGEILVRDLPSGKSDDEKLEYALKKTEIFTSQTRPKIDAFFRQNECDSSTPEMLDAKKAHELFSTVHPFSIHQMIQERIQKKVVK